MKTYILAILADTCTSCATNSILVTPHTSITAKSHKEASKIAAQIGALVCGWRLAA